MSDTVLAHNLELDPQTTARKLPLSLGISVQGVKNHLHHNMGLKCCHLRWIPQLLHDPQKAEKTHCAPIMLEALDDHARTKNEYLITGDESEMIDDRSPSSRSALDRDHPDVIIWPRQLRHFCQDPTQMQETGIVVLQGSSSLGDLLGIPWQLAAWPSNSFDPP
jgi:hypothetical protein